MLRKLVAKLFDRAFTEDPEHTIYSGEEALEDTDEMVILRRQIASSSMPEATATSLLDNLGDASVRYPLDYLRHVAAISSRFREEIQNRRLTDGRELADHLARHVSLDKLALGSSCCRACVSVPHPAPLDLTDYSPTSKLLCFFWVVRGVQI